MFKANKDKEITDKTKSPEHSKTEVVAMELEKAEISKLFEMEVTKPGDQWVVGGEGKQGVKAIP